MSKHNVFACLKAFKMALFDVAPFFCLIMMSIVCMNLYTETNMVICSSRMFIVHLHRTVIFCVTIKISNFTEANTAFILIVTCCLKMFFSVHLIDCHCKNCTTMNLEMMEEFIKVSNNNCVVHKSVKTVKYELLNPLCLLAGSPNKPIICLTGFERLTTRNTAVNKSYVLIVMFCLIVAMFCNISILEQKYSMVLLLANIYSLNGCGTHLQSVTILQSE